MAAFTYWSVEPPTKWQAGSVGAERKPFYFDCADCGAKEPPIAGIISTDGTFNGIGLIKTENSPFVKAAMFCAPCFEKRTTECDGCGGLKRDCPSSCPNSPYYDGHTAYEG